MTRYQKLSTAEEKKTAAEFDEKVFNRKGRKDKIAKSAKKDQNLASR